MGIHVGVYAGVRLTWIYIPAEHAPSFSVRCGAEKAFNRACGEGGGWRGRGQQQRMIGQQQKKSVVNVGWSY